MTKGARISIQFCAILELGSCRPFVVPWVTLGIIIFKILLGQHFPEHCPMLVVVRCVLSKPTDWLEIASQSRRWWVFTFFLAIFHQFLIIFPPLFACNRCWCPSGTWKTKPGLNPSTYAFTTNVFPQLNLDFAFFDVSKHQIITISSFNVRFCSSLRL